MTLVVEAQSPPIQVDRDGVIRVGGSRVTLDTVVNTFNQGHTAEEIVSHYPALKLADVYAVISCYLNNQAAVKLAPPFTARRGRPLRNCPGEL